MQKVFKNLIKSLIFKLMSHKKSLSFKSIANIEDKLGITCLAME